MASAKPTILLVPGSFSPAALVYSRVSTPLRAHGYQVIPIELPTVGPPSARAPASMEDDAAHIAGIASKLIDGEGKDVVIAMNSYGGIPGTQACKGLIKTEREKEGKKGGVVGLVYLTALLIPEGANLAQGMASAGGIPDYVKVDEAGYMTLEAGGNVKVTFNDLPESEALEWAAHMPGHSGPSFAGILTYPAYKYVPVTYLHCQNDKVITPEAQLQMIELAKSVSESTVDVVNCTSGHAVMVSQPEKCVEAILKAAGGA